MNNQLIIRLLMTSLIMLCISMPSISAASKPYQLPANEYQELKYRNDRGETLKFRGTNHFRIKWINEMDSTNGIVMNKEKNLIFVTEENEVIAFDLAGNEQWRYTLPNYNFNFYYLHLGADGTIYAINHPLSLLDNHDSGHVIALSVQGALLWDHKFENQKLLRWMIYDASSNGTFVTITDDAIVGVRNGKIIWSNTDILKLITERSYYYEYTYTNIINIFSDRKGTIYVQTDNKLYALNGLGKVRWSRDFKPQNGSLVLVQNDKYILSTSFGQWTLLDSATGKSLPGSFVNPVWLKDTSLPNDGRGGLYLSNYLQNNRNGLYKIDSKGKLLWEYKVRFSGYSHVSDFVSDLAGNVYFTDSGGTFYSLDRNGNERFMIVVRNQYGPTLTKSVIDKDGNVYALMRGIGLIKITK